MRQAMARGVALGIGLAMTGAVALFAVLQQGRAGEAPAPGTLREEPVALTSAGTVPDTILEAGRRVYDAEGCAACHSIARVGSPRSPLDGVGSRLEEEEVRLWIVDPQAMRPGIRKPAYDDLGADRLQALVAYMMSLTD